MIYCNIGSYKLKKGIENKEKNNSFDAIHPVYRDYEKILFMKNDSKIYLEALSGGIEEIKLFQENTVNELNHNIIFNNENNYLE